MILGHELELQRPGIVSGDRLQHRFMRVGDNDRAQQSRGGRFVQRPVEYGLESDGKHLLRQPSRDWMQPRTQPTARNTRRVEGHEMEEVTGKGGAGGRTRVSCTLTIAEGDA